MVGKKAASTIVDHTASYLNSGTMDKRNSGYSYTSKL
jgi:hypothetical protein